MEIREKLQAKSQKKSGWWSSKEFTVLDAVVRTGVLDIWDDLTLEDKYRVLAYRGVVDTMEAWEGYIQKQEADSKRKSRKGP